MKKFIYAVAVFALPVVTFAQPSQIIESREGLFGVAELIKTILGWLVPILISAAMVMFLWGVLMYVIKSDPESKETARHTMIYGIIGLAVMVSVWGLVRVLTETFGVDNETQAVPVPKLPGLNSAQ